MPSFPGLFRRCAAIVRATGGTELLVEDFLPGREFVVEGIVRSGIPHTFAVFEKPEPLDGPFFEEGIYVPHCFQKKNKRGIATPKVDLDIIRARLKMVEQIARELTS